LGFGARTGGTQVWLNAPKPNLPAGRLPMMPTATGLPDFKITGTGGRPSVREILPAEIHIFYVKANKLEGLSNFLTNVGQKLG
jgi:hypothetical protein